MSRVVRLSSQNHWPNVPICWLLTNSPMARLNRLLKVSSVIGFLGLGVRVELFLPLM